MINTNDPEQPATPLWRNSNYLLLQVGQAISYIGSQQQFIALPLLVLALTGSPALAGAVVGFGTIAVLIVSPFGGVLADLRERKGLMIVCDLGRLALTLTIPLAWWWGVLSLPQIILVVILTGVLGTLFTVANAAAMPTVVTAEQLPTALAQTQATTTVVRTIGSLLGGTLYTLSVTLPFLVNAISFGISVLSLGATRGNFSRTLVLERTSLYQSVSAGFTWLWRQPLLRVLTLLSGGDSLRYGAGYLVILVLAQELGSSPRGIGAIFTGAALGALLGNIAGGALKLHARFGWIVIVVLWLEGLLFPLYAIAPAAFWIGLIAAAEEFVSPFYNVKLNGFRLARTPDQMRGRVSSTVLWVNQGANAIGALVSGLLIQGVGAKGSAVVLGGWLIILALIATMSPLVRQATYTNG